MGNLVENKKAHLEYEMLEQFDAGLSLLGSEVKSLRLGRASLVGARILIRGNEAYLVGATITPYQEKNTPASYDPMRSRRLLLSQKEIRELSLSENQKGLTIIPFSVYNKGTKLKLRLAIVRHKKKHDKRDTLKDRDAKRSIDRTLKNQYE